MVSWCKIPDVPLLIEVRDTESPGIPGDPHFNYVPLNKPKGPYPKFPYAYLYDVTGSVRMLDEDWDTRPRRVATVVTVN